MMYNRACIYAPPGSGTRTLGDLARRVIGGPIGAAAERFAFRELANAGATNVRLAQLDMAAQSALLKAAGADAKSWPGVDALFGFDPLPAYFEDAALAKMLACGPVVSVVLASREMIEARRGELVDFLVAFARSWLWYAQDPARANVAFKAASGLDFTGAQLDRAASLEPNFTAASVDELRLTLTDKDIAILREARNFLAEKGVVPADLDFMSLIEEGPLRAALDRLRARKGDSVR